MLCRPSKSQYTRTKLRNPSVMISSIADSCIPADVSPQHTQVISTNRLCYIWCSQMIRITHMFVVYRTHLVMPNRLCSNISSHTVYGSELCALYRTHLDLGNRLCRQHRCCAYRANHSAHGQNYETVDDDFINR